MNSVLRLRKLLALDRKEISHVYGYALLNGLVNLSLPLGIQAIINLIQGGEISASWMVLVSFVILGIVLSGFFQIIQLRIVENISQKIMARASFDFAYRIPRINAKSIYGYYAPELVNRFFDIITLQKGVPKLLIDFSLAVFQIAVGLILLGLYHPFFIIFGLSAVLLIFIMLKFSSPKGLSTSLQESKYKYDIAHWLEEVAKARVSFKLIGDSKLSLNEVDEKLVKYISARESHFNVLLLQFKQLVGFKVLIAAGLLILGSILVFRQEMNIGQFVAAEILIIIIISSVEKLIKSFESVYDVLTGLEKLGYVFDMPLDPEIKNSKNHPLDHISIKLEEVDFTYPDGNKKIIENLTLDIPRSNFLIKGSSGSGKSTLIQLLSGLLEPTSGFIKINNIPIQHYSQEQLKSRIGYFISSNQIIHGSLLGNISMGRDRISYQDCMDAAKLVDLDKFIHSLPNGLYSIIDPEGKKMPQSVVDKILLARAIAGNPDILILEDPLEHMSSFEKQEIITRLVNPNNSWAIIVSAVDSIWEKHIEQFIELDQGKIIHKNL